MGTLFLAPVMLISLFIGIGVCEKKGIKLDEKIIKLFEG